MKIVTGFKTTCDEIVTNFKIAIGSIVVSSQFGAQFLLHLVLKFATIFITRGIKFHRTWFVLRVGRRSEDGAGFVTAEVQ